MHIHAALQLIDATRAATETTSLKQLHRILQGFHDTPQ
jgi:hypothetical protein